MLKTVFRIKPFIKLKFLGRRTFCNLVPTTLFFLRTLNRKINNRLKVLKDVRDLLTLGELDPGMIRVLSNMCDLYMEFIISDLTCLGSRTASYVAINGLRNCDVDLNFPNAQLMLDDDSLSFLKKSISENYKELDLLSIQFNKSLDSLIQNQIDTLKNQISLDQVFYAVLSQDSDDINAAIEMDCSQYFDKRLIMLNDKAFLEKSIIENSIMIDKLMAENSSDDELLSEVFALQEQVNLDKNSLSNLIKELSHFY